MAENVFFRKIGPGYIEDCFRWAHQADPDAILLYNDNKVEGMNGPNKEKSDGFYHLLASLIKKGVPIHGCGIQAHFNAAGTGNKRVPTPRMVKNQIHRLGKLGLKVNISEMDCRVSQLAPDLRQIAQRQIYHDIIVAALTEPAFDGLWLWGFTDRHSKFRVVFVLSSLCVFVCVSVLKYLIKNCNHQASLLTHSACSLSRF
ncbi:MAG: endo-1,4-beta-xylanase [Bacillariaceae sp.]